jgi:hypothetical protein
MSATGFQRRRRELALQKEQRKEDSDPIIETVEVDTGTSETPIQTTTEKTGLAALSKKELAEYIGRRKLYDRSYKGLEPEAIIPLFIKSVQAKIVEAKLKTADEVGAMTEKELLDLFDTLK